MKLALKLGRSETGIALHPSTAVVVLSILAPTRIKVVAIGGALRLSLPDTTEDVDVCSPGAPGPTKESAAPEEVVVPTVAPKTIVSLMINDGIDEDIAEVVAGWVLVVVARAPSMSAIVDTVAGMRVLSKMAGMHVVTVLGIVAVADILVLVVKALVATAVVPAWVASVADVMMVAVDGNSVDVVIVDVVIVVVGAGVLVGGAGQTRSLGEHVFVAGVTTEATLVARKLMACCSRHPMYPFSSKHAIIWSKLSKHGPSPPTVLLQCTI